MAVVRTLLADARLCRRSAIDSAVPLEQHVPVVKPDVATLENRASGKGCVATLRLPLG